jgi:hypothetical protein
MATQELLAADEQILAAVTGKVRESADKAQEDSRSWRLAS